MSSSVLSTDQREFGKILYGVGLSVRGGGRRVGELTGEVGGVGGATVARLSK